MCARDGDTLGSDCRLRQLFTPDTAVDHGGHASRRMLQVGGSRPQLTQMKIKHTSLRRRPIFPHESSCFGLFRNKHLGILFWIKSQLVMQWNGFLVRAPDKPKCPPNIPQQVQLVAQRGVCPAISSPLGKLPKKEEGTSLTRTSTTTATTLTRILSHHRPLVKNSS